MKKPRLSIGALALSAVGLLGIAEYEGFSPVAYIPVPGDVPTIGFGSTSGVKMGDEVSVSQALNMLNRDTGFAQEALYNCVSVPLTQNEYDAYVSFAYNVGSSAFCSSTLVKKLNAGDYDGACSELKRWVYVKGKKVQGLVNRREKEYEQCMRR